MYISVVFDNQIAKFKDRKAHTSNVFVGNDVYSDVLARSSAKTAFDGDVMCNPEIMVKAILFSSDRLFVFISAGLKS